MSTKTLRKRIALVAVSAMGFGLLTSVSAKAAGEVAASTLFVAAGASNTGAAGTASLVTANMTSVGWISKTSTAGTTSGTGYTLASGDAGTAVVYSGAKIAWTAGSAATASSHLGVVVTGGTLSDITNVDAGADAPSLALSGSATTAVHYADTDANTEFFGGVFNVTGAPGTTATISVYGGTGITGLTSATNGALIGTWTFTVASASASGVYSAADSSIYVQAAIAKGGTSSTTTAYDAGTSADNGQVAVIWVKTIDAFTAAVTGTLTASSTAGNVVITTGTVAAGDSYSGTSTYDSEGSWDGEGYIVITQPTANTAGSATVTITLDGAVIATKTVKWNGVAASISLDAANSAGIFKNGYTAWTSGDAQSGNIVYVIKDAAGNVVTASDVATKLSISSQTGSMVGASLSQTDTTGAIADANIDYEPQTIAAGYGLATMLIPTSALNGAGTYKLKYVTSLGTAIYSPVINATVSGAAATFTAKWDKDSYNPGDIASLTIAAKDANGNPVADIEALGTGALVTTNTDGLSSVTSSCDAANIAATVYLGGQKVCKFAVKNTPGSYSYTVTVPTSSAQSATTGTVKVVSATTTVTNAEVLAAIVKLIASINKQIAALQKALTKKK